MYRHCLHCAADLGANEAIEAFPVGRRLAFDEARGRLWVVCRGCGRWNLSPVEERWEAIEQCEALFRGLRLRASTSQIGVGRAPDDTDLIRIGAPPPLEFAAWRYGAVFRKRRSHARLFTLVSAALGAATRGASLWGAAALSSVVTVAGTLPEIAVDVRRRRRIVDRVSTPRGAVVIRGKHATQARLTHDAAGEMAVLVPDGRREWFVEGEPARQFLRRLLPDVNHYGATEKELDGALTHIDHEGGPQGLIRRLSRGPLGPRPTWRPMKNDLPHAADAWSFRSFGYPTILALEMSLHEDAERRALEGELDALHAAWREAEEIAAIADSLLVPTAADTALARLRHALGKD